VLALALAVAAAPSRADAAYRRGFNCGSGSEITTGDGARYEADRDYGPGEGAGRIGGVSVPNNQGDVSEMGGIVPDLQTGRLLRSYARGWREYRFDVPDGRYLISLHFMESTHHWRGLRAFTIRAEGETIADSLDIFDRVDRRFALNLRRAVDVSDGQLNVTAFAGVDESILQAIYVGEVSHDGQAPAVPTGLTVIPSYREAILSWDPVYAPDQLGVVAWRTDLTAGGAEEPISEHPLVATRHVDPGLDPEHDYRYRLTAIDAWGNESALGAPVVVSPIDSDESPLPVHAFEMSDEDLRWLNTHRNSDDLLPGTYHIDGETWDEVGIRYRGNTTRSLIKKNYKIRADNADPFPPNRIKINLQSEWRVPSLLREKTSYDAFALSEALGSVAAYTHLERNGRYIGAYLDIEQVDEFFLAERDLEGSLWKADTEAFGGDFTRKGNLAGYYDPYVLEVGSYRDYELLDEFITMVNTTSKEEFRTEILRYLDVPEFLSWYASQALISNWDHVIHNYYLFRDQTTGLFHFVPWDLELGWDDVRHPIAYGTRADRYFFLFYNRLFDKLMTTPQYRRMYAVHLERLLEFPFTPGTILGLIRRDHALLRPEMERDLYKPGWDDMGVYDDDLTHMEDFAERRRDNIFRQLETFATDPTVNLFVNEALPWNVEGAVDEAGDHDPWVELHNFGNERIEIGGFWLSNDPGSRESWQLPAGTGIDPGGHLIVWLDGESGEGPLHASFALRRSDSTLILADGGGGEIDRLDLVGPALPDVPTARSPDGAVVPAPLAVATPGEPNGSGRLAELRLDAPTEYFPGDPAALTLSIDNRREFPRQMTVEARVIAGEQQVPVAEIGVDLVPWEQWSETVWFDIPEDAPPVEYTVVAELRDELGRPAGEADLLIHVRDPRPITLYVNEIMADNDTTLEDEAEQFDDWIELYNPGPRPVQLDGLYLSDDGADRRKWAIPAFVLGPNGHLVIWCDDDPEQGVFHAPFKLDAAGEEIGIYDLDLRGNTAVDRIVFMDLDDDAVLGRSPDGSPNIRLLPYATPGAPNP